MKKIQIIAVLSALIMFICGYYFISSESDGDRGVAKRGEISVVVATQDIAPYTKLTSDMITIQHLPEGRGLVDYYTSVSDVEGSICTSEVFSGEVLTANRLASADDAALGLGTHLEKGKRAISVEVDTEQGVANNLKVGNYVDVVFTAQIQGGVINGLPASAGMILSQVYGGGDPANTQIVGENLGQFFSVIALQKIKVIALGDRFYSDRNTSGEELQYGSVTLEVTPVQAAKIALLNDNDGKIQLILRSQDDESTVNESRESVLKRYSR